jgi:hypothetical protein
MTGGKPISDELFRPELYISGLSLSHYLVTLLVPLKHSEQLQEVAPWYRYLYRKRLKYRYQYSMKYIRYRINSFFVVVKILIFPSRLHLWIM